MINIKWNGEDIVESKVKDIIASKLPIVFWGFGGTAIHQYEYLKKMIPIACFVDNNPQKVGMKYDGVEILSFLQLKQRFKNRDCNILITVNSNKYVEEIQTQIKEDGQFNKVYYLDLYYPLGKDIKSQIRDDFDKIEKVYDLLCDEESKQCFENKINYMITKDKKYLSYNTEYRVYFPEDIFNFGTEVFVDGGAYHGEDTLALMQRANVEGAYLFEPDKNNYQYVIDNVKSYKCFNVYNAALWKEDTILTFSEQGTMGSSIHECGNCKVMAKKIDNCEDAKNKVTFIKLDVEGAELEALDGAKETITNQEPKLSVCIYHKVNHHWEVPLKILEICPHYDLYMRQDDQTGMETVCYGKSRNKIGG